MRTALNSGGRKTRSKKAILHLLEMIAVLMQDARTLLVRTSNQGNLVQLQGTHHVPASQGTYNTLLCRELPSTSVPASLTKDFSKDNREIKIRIYHPDPKCKLFLHRVA